MTRPTPPYRITFTRAGKPFSTLDCYAVPLAGDVITLDGADFKVEMRHFHDLTAGVQQVTVHVALLF
jgi:hypothetical protein